MRASINALTAALIVGVIMGLALTPDGRGWLRNPTLMLGSANASASPPAPQVTAAVARPEPVAPAAPRITPLSRRLAEGELVVGVIGDSMADGLWTGVYRDLRDVDGVRVVRMAEVSTGLSRYDYVNVQDKTARQLREQPIDAAVVMFGTNDAQAIEHDGVIHQFGTPGWREIYARRVDDLVGLLRENDVAVYWVGLPRMKRESFDGRMAQINELVAGRMAALDVPYIDTVALTSNEGGDYDAYLAASDGRRRLMRAHDGIHMSMAGYLRLTEPVTERLRADAGLNRIMDGAADGAAG
ncbi:DUF459 domain-containing protein [Brevundimonas sp.]|uniref:SGNH/GDSL hydrolase family protein n=1 Tax=Brevundimonas sp. TaxID=1871086 RepID=UPI0039E42DD4